MYNSKTMNFEQIKTRAFIEYGIAGHEDEYVFSLDGVQQVPHDLAHKLEVRLGKNWHISYRSTRLEIYYAEKENYRDDEFIITTLQQVLGDEYELVR